jgi:glycosyltransferase involved in cell wall biosynthesis
MIRVAFIDQQGRSAGGAEESLALLLRFLPAEIEPIAVLFEDGPFADRLRALGIEVAIYSVPERIKRSTREHPRLESALGVPQAAAGLARVLRDRKVDVVYTNTIKAHIVGGVAARLAKLPCISHLRDILDGQSLQLVRFALRALSWRRIAISRAVDDCFRLGKTEVIPNPVDLAAYDALPSRAEARATLGIAWDGPLFGMVGRINRWKGHDRFLRIARLVVDRVPAKLVIAGSAMFRDADFETELHAMVRELGLENDVTFLPWQEDPRPVYAALDLLCNCSTREPFGRTTVEAAAAGRPTVCFDDGGAAEAIDDGSTGRAVAAGDETAFAGAVIAYLENDAVRCEAAKRARAFAQRFRAELHASRVAVTIASVRPVVNLAQ